MSKEYIDRNELLELYQDDKLDLTKTCVPVEVAIQNIKDMPAADVAEVVHGEWKNHRCNACGDVNPTITEDFYGYYISNQLNYCPNCGAKMDGGKANE